MRPGDKVSVVIPVYQGERCVRGAVQSALRQTHKQLEVVVVDDGSTDNTWSILRSINDSRLRILRQSNAGAAASRNRGLANVSGDYVAFLDADDRWLPHKLEAELATLRAAESPVAIAYSWYYAVSDTGTLLHRSPPVKYSGFVFRDLLRGFNFILPSASLLHRSIFADLGGFNVDRRYHEDYAFTLRAVRKYPAYPSCRYSVIYEQSLRGKARSVLRNHEAAVTAALSLGDDLRDVLSPSELDEFLQSQRKSLYLRFLMYGFDRSAAALLKDIPPSSLPGTPKGWLGWVFARTGINLMPPSRSVVQGLSRVIHERRWRRLMNSARLTLCDDPQSEDIPSPATPLSGADRP